LAKIGCISVVVVVVVVEEIDGVIEVGINNRRRD